MNELPNPLRDFVDQLRKTSNAMVRETKELDDALLRGRVGDMVRKYSQQAKDELSDDDDDEGARVEGTTG